MSANAVIFDMDGLLLDTEPLWGESMMEVASSHNIQMTYADLRFTTGLKIYEVTAYWKDSFLWGTSATSEQVAEDILDHVINNTMKNGKVMPGIINHLEYLYNQKIPLGIATSSPRRMMEALVSHFNIDQYFNYTTTGNDCILGKPHPEVYLKCAEGLNIPSFRCIAVEDSINGMVAAKAARMKCIVVPEVFKMDNPSFGLADAKYSTMKEMPFEKWKQLMN